MINDCISIIMEKFLTINYLKTGNPRQQLAYKELVDLEIMEKLNEFSPLLAGTIPIEIDTKKSDLDIVCTCSNHEIFSETLKNNFSNQKNFNIKIKKVKGIQTIIATFNGKHYSIEIFGQQKPSKEQDAFRHMLIEAQILKEKDSIFTKKIIHLKKSGIKTEPAFAKLLGLEGNPYDELLYFLE